MGYPDYLSEALAHKFAEELRARGNMCRTLPLPEGSRLRTMYSSNCNGCAVRKSSLYGRATMIPAMVGKNIERWMREDKLPPEIKKYGDSIEKIFVSAETIKAKYGKAYKKIPAGAIGMFTFCDRLQVGLQQLMAGARKFAIQYIDRSDLVSLTKEATEVTVYLILWSLIWRKLKGSCPG